MKTLSSNLRTIIILTAVLALLAGFDYLEAWTKPVLPAPQANVAAPLNTSGATQLKTGTLGTGSLIVTGIQHVNSPNPLIRYTDTDPGAMSYRTLVNSDRMFIQADRDKDGIFTAADLATLMTFATGATTAGDFAVFSNQVRANAYCDKNGANCSTPGGSASLPTCAAGEVLVAQSGGGWACGANYEQCHRFASQYGNGQPIIEIIDGATNITHIAMIGNYNSGYGSMDKFLWTGGWQSDYHSWGYFVGRSDAYVTSTLIPANKWANVTNKQSKTISLLGPNNVTMQLSYSYGSCY